VRDGVRFCDSCGQSLEAATAASAAVIRGPATVGVGAGGGTGDGYGGGPGTGNAFTGALNNRFPGLLERVKNILLTPKTEWPVIETEATLPGKLLASYVIPLAALSAMVSFVKMSVIGISIPFIGTIRTPFVSGLVATIVGFGVGLLGFFLFGLIINLLAPTFGGRRDFRQALKVAGYTATPVWVGSVLGLLPFLAALLQFAAAIYAIYLLYLGLPQLMQSARDRAAGYTFAVIVCCILAGIVLGVLNYLTGFGRYGGFGGFGSPAITGEERQRQTSEAVANALGNALGSDDKSKQGLAAAIGGFAEIGRKMEQQQAANASSAAQNGGGSADPAANAQAGAAAAVGVLSALGGAMAGDHKVDPVDFHALKVLLPESLPGMQRSNAEGSSQAALGMKSSEATATYQGAAGARAEIKIADASAVAGLMGAAGGIAQTINSESDTGYERNTTIGGQAAHEKYDKPSNHGDITIIVAKRFAVDVSGDGVDMGTLEQYAGAINFAQLVAMKDLGARAN
jgi:hypothetical protein